MTTYDEVKQIKRLLWEGHLTQTAIARRYKTSQPTVSRIAQGSWWADVPWPDEGTGAMSPDRDKVIKESRRRHASLSSRRCAAARQGSQAAGYLRLSRENLFRLIDEPPCYTWEQIKYLDPAHPLATTAKDVADISGVGLTPEKAIRVTLSLLPIEEWGIAPTYELIERVRKELEK